MSIYNKLYNFQRNIVDEFKSYKRFGLFLDMGLGKTPTSLAFAEQNGCNKVLVITINSKALEKVTDKGSWLYWANNSDIDYVFHTKSTSCDKIYEFKSKPQLFILNYESLFKRGKRSSRTNALELSDKIQAFLSVCKNKNVAVIVDESHKIKNLQSQQTKAISRIVSTLEKCSNELKLYLCTGTPFTTGYIDLYSQLKLLGCSESKQSFIDKFCIRGRIPGLFEWQQPIVGYKNINDLFKLVHEYAITIQSEEVVKLANKVVVDITLPVSDVFDMYSKEKCKGTSVLNFAKKHNISLNNEDLTRYNTTKSVSNPFFRNIDYPNLDFFAETSGTAWLRARQLSIGFIGNAKKNIWYDKSRLNALKSFLEKNEDNYVLFYNYTAELYEIFEICESLNYNVDVYCGEVKSMTHYNKFAALTNEEKLVTKKNIILANFASGSTGMNWQEYNKCILFSVACYKDYTQAIKRILRLGQASKVVMYYRFFQENWLDIGMNKALDAQVDYNEKMFQADITRINELKEKE